MLTPRPVRLPSFGACFPSGCAVCGRWPSLPAGKPVCHDCQPAFAPPTARCPTCALALPTDTRVCADCQTAPQQLIACFAAVDYTYPWQRLVHRFKFANEPAWATWFADLLWQQSGLPQAACACDWWLPIPLTPLRLGERGYNQAWELVHALARHVPTIYPTMCRVTHLARFGQQPPCATMC